MESRAAIRRRPRPIAAQPEAIPLAIVYEDADLLVINKPAGMVVHPAAGNWRGTLVNAVLFHARDLEGHRWYFAAPVKR